MAVEGVLHWLASLVALTGAAPAFSYLDPMVQVIFSLSLVFGLVRDRRQLTLLSALPATLLSLLVAAFYLLQMNPTTIVEPLVNLLVALLAVRLVTEKSGRNLLQIFVLSTFVLASSSLLTLSAGYLLALMLLIALVAIGLLLTSFYATDAALRLDRQQWFSLARTGAILPLGSLLLMIFFFVILPRTQYPLWHFLNPGTRPTSGFSEEVSPGTLANLNASGAPAFRAEMSAIAPQDLYWRGLVLNQTDGQSWSRAKNFPPDQTVKNESRPLKQILMSEPRSNRYLPGLDLPAEPADISSQRSSDAVNEAHRRLDRRVRYTLYSYPRGSLQIRDPSQSDFYLRLPDSLSPRLRGVSESIAAEPDRQAKIAAVEQFFLAQKLAYATSNLPQNNTPVETFLFDSKRGYCEYFASSFALLLRMSGVPARLVGGYLGGRYNALGGYYLIDEDMAHVWVEALNDENHWRRIDPSRLAINAGEAVAGLSRRPFNWSQSAADYLETAWSRLVITYDLQKQLSLALSLSRNFRQFRPSLPQWVRWWVFLPLLAGGVFLWGRRKYRLAHHHQSVLDAYLKQVKKAAELDHLPESLGLYELAERSHEPLCHDFSRIYGAAIYAGKNLSPEEQLQLRVTINQLKTKRFFLKPDFAHLTDSRRGELPLVRHRQPAYTAKHLD